MLKSKNTKSNLQFESKPTELSQDDLNDEFEVDVGEDDTEVPLTTTSLLDMDLKTLVEVVNDKYKKKTSVDIEFPFED